MCGVLELVTVTRYATPLREGGSLPAHSGNLHFWNISAGCLGGFDAGDRARLSLTFTVSPKQAITSP